MQTYDFLMLAVLAGLTWYGYMKGMAWQIAYVASFVASYFVSMNFADRLAPLFGSSAPFNKFAAMLAMYIASSFGIWSVFRLVRGLIDSVKMEGFDHQMGALLGFARGVLWCVGITFFAVTLLPGTQKEQIIASRSGHYISVLLSKTKSIAPPEVAQVINPYIEKVERGISGQGGLGELASGWPGAGTGAAPAPTGWPNNYSQPAVPQPQAPAAPGPFQWPQAPPQQPAANPWPQSNVAPQTPAQPASWPQWPQQ